MALMTPAQRRECWQKVMSMLLPGQVVSIDKLALQRCIDACDTVIDGNAGTLNQQIHAAEATWTQLSQTVRSRIFSTVILERYDKGVS
jgi:hypothetical protein